MGLGGGLAVVSSWSGGKDSCLALHRALRGGARVRALVSMLAEGGGRSRAHGLSPAVLQAQADALGVPLVTGAASWADYEGVFTALLQQLRAEGVEGVVFGDIDDDEHWEWENRVCAAVGLEALLPLWKAERRALLDEFLGLGFQATIVAVRAAAPGSAFLGRALTPEVAGELESLGVDVCGENGEFHTLVTGGPLFSRALRLRPGERVFKDGYWFLDVLVEGRG